MEESFFASSEESLIYLVNMDNELSNVCGGELNQTFFFQELEERTNIHITWSTSPKNLRSLYQFQQNDRSHPDMIDYGQLYNIYGKSLEQCLSDGIIMDLTDLVEKYAPNYYRLIQQSEYHDFAYTSSGQIAAIHSLKQERQNSYAGLQIRKDWLDELHLDIPVTYDDWETVLTAFKEKKGSSAPLYFPASGYMADETFHAGFGVSSGFFHIGDTVYYGPAEDVSMCDVWSENDDAYILPSGLIFEPKEQKRLAEISEALYPVVSQYTISFISGMTPFSEYDTYLDQLDACGLKEALEIYQDAWNRYNSQK